MLAWLFDTAMGSGPVGTRQCLVNLLAIALKDIGAHNVHTVSRVGVDPLPRYPVETLVLGVWRRASTKATADEAATAPSVPQLRATSHGNP